MIRLFLFNSLLLLKSYSIAQHADSIEQAWNHYLNLQLDSCELCLGEKGEFRAHYLFNLSQATKVFLSDDVGFYKKNKHIENDQLTELNNSKFKEQELNFLRSEVKLQWALIQLKNGEEFSAFWNLKQAYSIAKGNIQEFPNFHSSFKTLGFLNVVFGVVPDKYDWILKIFGIESDISIGLSYLQIADKEGGFMALEAQLIRALLSSYLLNKPANGAEILSSNYEVRKHLLTVYAYALVLMKNAESEKALTLIQEFATKKGSLESLPQLKYVLGEIFLQKGMPETSISYYSSFLENFQGQNLMKDANFKIGLCHLLMNQTDSMEMFFERSRDVNWAKNEADKNARHMLAAEVPFKPDLIQLRYATDGGYFLNAREIHNQIDTTDYNQHDLCEYYYRSGRLHQKMGNVSLAQKFYLQTIKKQKENNWYYAPNSALQLGLINIEDGNKEKAEEYLQMVRDYNNHNYQNSIRRNAKSALKSLN